MISDSFRDTHEQNADRKIILALFFLHLMNENKQYRVTNKISNKNKYSSPTVNNHHGDRYPKKLANFIVENRTYSTLHDKMGQFYWQTESADFCMTEDRFFANFTGRLTQPTLSII